MKVFNINQLNNYMQLADTILLYSKTFQRFRNKCLDLTDTSDIINAMLFINEPCNTYSVLSNSKRLLPTLGIYNRQLFKFMDEIDLSDIFNSRKHIGHLIFLAYDNTSDFTIFKDDIDYLLASQPLIIKHINAQLLDIFKPYYKHFTTFNDTWEIYRFKRVLHIRN